MSRWSPRRDILLGLLAIMIGLGGFAAWAMLTEIDGAVIAPGRVEVEARRQIVQHPDGGLVKMIHVREGQLVAAGDPIISLDGAELTAERALAERERLELWAQIDRLSAEARGDKALAFRPALSERAQVSPEIDAMLQSEAALFVARRQTLDQTLAQLKERKIQSEAGIDGREQQLDADSVQLKIVRADLEAQKSLLEQALTQTERVSALEREEARIDGDVGRLRAEIAEARSEIAGYEIERLRLMASWQEAAQAELRRLQPEEAKLNERLQLIDTKLSRLVLRAPMAGRVLAMKTFTIGGVIPAGSEVAGIVPVDVPLIVVVDIDPLHIDQVHVGQDVIVRFPNFNARVTPQVAGRISTVSPDTVADPATARRFYLAEVTLIPTSETRPILAQLSAGMPVEAVARTAARSPMSFLLKPIMDYWTYAMREE